jgi:hypothetical protein
VESQRLITAISNSFARILITLGIILALTPADRFSQAYAVMFESGPKDLWAIGYMIAGSLGFLALYQGSWKYYRWAIYVCAAAYSILASIFWVASSTKVGALLYGNIAASCIFYSAGYPIFGPIPCATPVSRMRLPQAILTVASNQFARILLCYGAVLFLTPVNAFSDAYNVIFALAPKGVWAFGLGGLGVAGLITLALGKVEQYRRIVVVFAVAFAIQAVLIGLGSQTSTGTALYLNLALDCLLYRWDKPIYGFVTCDRGGDTDPSSNPGQPVEDEMHDQSKLVS